MSQKIFHLFDLDGTVIDSLHRVKPCLKEGGDLDLAMYRREACTHDKIMSDELLPLVDKMRGLIAAGESVGICTARSMNKSDYIFLRQHGIKTAFIASRDRIHKFFPADMVKAICYSGDAAYKAAWLQMLKATRPEATIHLYDDHDGVLEAAARLGVTAFDAKTLNDQLDKAFMWGMQEAISQMEQEQGDQEELLSDASMFAGVYPDAHEVQTFGALS